MRMMERRRERILDRRQRIMRRRCANPWELIVGVVNGQPGHGAVRVGVHGGRGEAARELVAVDVVDECLQGEGHPTATREA